MKNKVKIFLTLVIMSAIVYFISPSEINAMSADEAGMYIAQFSLNFAKAYGKETYYTVANYMDNVNSPRAYAYRGKKYTMSSNQASGKYFWLDCVGWVSMAIHRSLGIGSNDTFTYWAVPTQYARINQGGFELLDFSESILKPGDILCNSFHVMIYCGNGKIVHCDGAGPDGTGVHEENLRSYYAYNSITKIVRITDEVASKIDPNNCTVLFDGIGAVDGTWTDQNQSTSQAIEAQGWIVDPNDKLELFKHILFTEKYNFNYIKWERYGHDDASFGVTSSSNNNSSTNTSGGSSSGGDNSNEPINEEEGYRGTVSDSKGREYKEYKQGFSPWRDVEYWGGTIHGKGCGPTTLAIIASGYGINETPATIAGYMGGNTGSDTLSNALTNCLHLKNTIYYSDIKNKMKENLKAGRPVVISTTNSLFTSNSHIIAGIKINENDEVWISNPNSGTKNGFVSIDDVVSGCDYIITIDQDTK